MTPQHWLSYATVFVALAVPFLTFRLASRQEHVKWVREQRLHAYVDFLTVVNEIATFEVVEQAHVDQGMRRHGSRRYSESAVRLSVVASPKVAAQFDAFDTWFATVEKWPVPDTVEPEFDRHFFALTGAMRHELRMHRGSGSLPGRRGRDYQWRLDRHSADTPQTSASS